MATGGLYNNTDDYLQCKCWFSPDFNVQNSSQKHFEVQKVQYCAKVIRTQLHLVLHFSHGKFFVFLLKHNQII